MKHERFFAHDYFSNETVSQTTVPTGPMTMFCLEHETINVCQRNVAHFVHVECRFDKIKDKCQGFGTWCHHDFREMEASALKVRKFGRTYMYLTGIALDQDIVIKYRTVLRTHKPSK